MLLHFSSWTFKQLLVATGNSCVASQAASSSTAPVGRVCVWGSPSSWRCLVNPGVGVGVGGHPHLLNQQGQTGQG